MVSGGEKFIFGLWAGPGLGLLMESPVIAQCTSLEVSAGLQLHWNPGEGAFNASEGMGLPAR